MMNRNQLETSKKEVNLAWNRAWKNGCTQNADILSALEAAMTAINIQLGDLDKTAPTNTEEFTVNEQKMLNAFYETSMEACGDCSEDENLSYMNARDLKAVLGGSLQAIGGTMSSLEKKCAISDTGESARKDNVNDFVTNTYRFFNL